MHALAILACIVLAQSIASQEIQDIVSKDIRVYRILSAESLHRRQWQTTWDQGHLLSDISPSTPINFTSPSVIGQADIVVDDSSTFQSVWGFGGSLSKLRLYFLLTRLKIIRLYSGLFCTCPEQHEGRRL